MAEVVRDKRRVAAAARAATLDLRRRCGGRLSADAGDLSGAGRPACQHATAGSWLRTVCKHEAMRIRGVSRQRVVATERRGWDAEPVAGRARRGRAGGVAGTGGAGGRGAPALQARREVKAILLRADGSSYKEIGETFNWSHTKVNRLPLRRTGACSCATSRTSNGRRVVPSTCPCLSAIVDGEATPEDFARLRPAPAPLRGVPGDAEGAVRDRAGARCAGASGGCWCSLAARRAGRTRAGVRHRASAGRSASASCARTGGWRRRRRTKGGGGDGVHGGDGGGWCRGRGSVLARGGGRAPARASGPPRPADGWCPRLRPRRRSSSRAAPTAAPAWETAAPRVTA